MHKSATTNIIRLPIRATVVGERTSIPAAVSDPAQTRLAKALDDLNGALARQQAAMASWRAAIGGLRDVTGRLRSGLLDYQDQLGQLEGRVNMLKAEAGKFESSTDGGV